jgi:hypothetical protein
MTVKGNTLVIAVMPPVQVRCPRCGAEALWPAAYFFEAKTWPRCHKVRMVRI